MRHIKPRLIIFVKINVKYTKVVNTHLNNLIKVEIHKSVEINHLKK
jgi:predicted nucleotide-binding protein (sugar kinase/HSP70/actin superfamily)